MQPINNKRFHGGVLHIAKPISSNAQDCKIKNWTANRGTLIRAADNRGPTSHLLKKLSLGQQEQGGKRGEKGMPKRALRKSLPGFEKTPTV